MKRIFITGAALLAIVPASLGLIGNASFAQNVPVRVPSQASVLDDHGGLIKHAEPGDDETLLNRAVEAATEERRRIAGALHDGVVQELAATSFAVAGSAERATSLGQPGLADELRSASDTVRTSIGGLRSLLVDIYPPSLATRG